MYKPVLVSVHAQEGKKPDLTGPLNPSDGDGLLIAPEDYKLKLQNISIVMVKVHFKMYVF